MVEQSMMLDPENEETRRLLQQMYASEDETGMEGQKDPYWHTLSMTNPMGYRLGLNRGGRMGTGLSSQLQGKSTFTGFTDQPESLDESELFRQAFGLNEEDAMYAMNPQYTWTDTWGQSQRDKGASSTLMREAMKEAGSGLENSFRGMDFKDWADWEKTANLIKSSSITRPTGEREQIGDYGKFVDITEPGYGSLKDKGVISTRGLSNEQALFRAWMKLPQETREKLDLKDERNVEALVRVGKQGEDWWSNTLKGDTKDISSTIKEYQPSKSGGNLLSRIAEVVMPAGLALLTGGALGLALGPATTIAGTTVGSGTLGATGSGIAGGSLGGTTAGLINQAKTGTMNLGQMLMSTGMGAIVGGAAGGLRSIFSSGGVNPTVSAAQQGTGMGLRGVTGAIEPSGGSWAGGLTSTGGKVLDVGKRTYGAYNELQAEQAAIDAQRAAFGQAAEPTAQATSMIPGMVQEQEQMIDDYWSGVRGRQGELLAARRQALEEEGYDPLASTQAGLF